MGKKKYGAKGKAALIIYEHIRFYLGLLIGNFSCNCCQSTSHVWSSDKDENDERHQYTAQKTLCESPIIRLVFNLPVAILTQVDVVISLGLSFFFGFEWLIDEDALESRHASCTIYDVCKMNMISYHLT